MGGLVLLIGASFYFLGYRPMIRRQETLDTNIHDMQKEFCDNAVRGQILPEVAKEVKQLRLRLDGAKKMPRDMDIAGFIQDMTRISQSTQLRKPKYLPDPQPKRGDLFSLYPIRCELQGNFANVFAFLRETESLPRLSRVRSINLKADPKDPGSVTVNLLIDLYFAPDL
jgi:Tfp pilus assembly protein PilO